MKILDEVQGAKTIGIAGHIRPDGDCVGSTMGMYLFLKKALPDVRVEVFLEKPASIYDCISGIEDIWTEFDEIEPFDVFIALDCSKDRLGKAETLFDKARKTINIDHHISNEKGTGMVNYLKPKASSASELVYEVIDKDYLDIEIARALYIGIIHDTGVFQYSNTSPQTLEIAGHLISYGFDFPSLIDQTFYEKTYVQNQVLGRALLESVLIMDGKCIFSVVDKKMMRFYDVEPGDLSSIVSQLRVIKGVECAIFMYETGLMEYKVSLRSNSFIDVAKVASYFGGGGHVRAAGCTMKGTCHDVVNNLSRQLELQIK